MKSRFSSPENFHFSSLLRVPTACVEIECKNSEKEGNGVVVSRSPRVIARSRLLNGFFLLTDSSDDGLQVGRLDEHRLTFRFTPRAR